MFIDLGVPPGNIILAACKDDCVTNLSQKAKLWFQSLGSKEINKLKYRQGFSFIGVSGKEELIERRAIKLKETVSITRVY